MTVRGERMVRDAEDAYPDPHFCEAWNSVASRCCWSTAGRRPGAVGPAE